MYLSHLLKCKLLQEECPIFFYCMRVLASCRAAAILQHPSLQGQQQGLIVQYGKISSLLFNAVYFKLLCVIEYDIREGLPLPTIATRKWSYVFLGYIKYVFAVAWVFRIRGLNGQALRATILLYIVSDVYFTLRQARSG